jgi:phage terminase large subunit GpA-like protein
MTSASSIAALDPRVLAVFQEAGMVLKPPSKLTVSQWAEKERMLSSESSATTGRYRCSIAPYQRAMMDAVHIPGVEEIDFFTAAQLGKSTCEENIGGFFMHEDPSPILWMWPTLEVAKEWAADTLEPAIRDTPALAEIVTAGARKTGNKTTFKSFPGGWIAVIGANSPSGLRRRRARIVICDEVDGYDASAGGEGDPIELVSQRGTGFWNFLRILASTCTVKGESRIEGAYEASNRQKYWVKCKDCGGAQVLKWKQIVCPKDEEPTVANTFYACEHCGSAHDETDKRAMLQSGSWVAERPEIVKRQGFWLSALYSPFEPWYKLVAKFRHATAHSENPELLKTFVNLSLAETWEEKEVDIDKEGLVRRCEHYTPALLPDGVILLTAGVDVQPDRLLVQVKGWGRNFESWSIDYAQIEGDTSTLKGRTNAAGQYLQSPWEKLDEFLQREYAHVRGVRLDIAATLVDSGDQTQEVYLFTKGIDLDRWVFAAKGMSTFDHPAIKPHNRNNKANVRMYPVGVSQIKKLLYQWLKIETPGPGYMHFTHHHCDAAYFDELTCERLKKKYEHGHPKKFWEKPAGARNEVLDCNVYAYAALLILSPEPLKLLERFRAQMMEEARKIKERGDPRQMELLANADAVDSAAPSFEKTAEVAKKLLDVLRPPAIPPVIGDQLDQAFAAAPINKEAAPQAVPPPEQPESEPTRPVRPRKSSSWLRGY